MIKRNTHRSNKGPKLFPLAKTASKMLAIQKIKKQHDVGSGPAGAVKKIDRFIPSRRDSATDRVAAPRSFSEDILRLFSKPVTTAESGEPFEVENPDLHICCGCRLVHKVEWLVKNKRLYMIFTEIFPGAGK